MAEAVHKRWFRRRSLFGKYVVSFVTLLVLVLAVNGAFETWFTYREMTQLLSDSQSEKAEAMARRIEQYVAEIERQISWATRASATTLEQRRSDYALLLQQVPPVDRVIQLDGSGKEQLRLTREGFVERSRHRLFGRSALQGNADNVSLVLAGLFRRPRAVHDHRDQAFRPQCRLDGRRDQSQIPDDVFRPAAVRQGHAKPIIVGPTGRLLAHTNPNYRLGTNMSDLPQVALEFGEGASGVFFGRDPEGRSVLTAAAGLEKLNWHVFFEQLTSTALQPVYNLLYRIGWLLALGVLLAVLSGMLLARQMVVPIKALQAGARQLEASDFGHRIEVKAADEIEELADHFNRMADQLQESYSRLEQKVEERTRDLEQSVRELKALEEIGRAVASSLDLKSVLATIVTRAVELSRGRRRRHLQLRSGPRGVRARRSAWRRPGVSRRELAPSRSSGTQASWGRRRRSASRSASPTSQSAPNYPLKELTLAAGFHSVLVVPLFGQDECLGSLVVQRRATGDFPASTVGLMQTFAHQSVLAMNNARLFREVEQKGRELAVAKPHKSQFFANMSHELRTPLNGVLGLCRTARRRPLRRPARQGDGGAGSDPDRTASICSA